MTLLLGFANSQQVALSGDRRFTNWDGSGFSDENVKVASFTCLDARLAFGFAGIAKVPGGFETAEWSLQTLLETAKPDYRVGPTLHRFTQAATQQWAKFSMDRQFLRTTFLFIGYYYGQNPPQACVWHISNCETEGSGPSELASDTFVLNSFVENIPPRGPWTAVLATGDPRGLDYRGADNDLREMLSLNKPVAALVQKAVSLIRDAALNPRSGGRVGAQISTVIIPRDPVKPIQNTYDTAVNSNALFIPNHVVALPDRGFAMRNSVLQVSSESDPAFPLLVPRIGRNSPCPCGSGKKYKRCHGNRKKRNFALPPIIPFRVVP
jgi:hypothetical protein